MIKKRKIDTTFLTRCMLYISVFACISGVNAAGLTLNWNPVTKDINGNDETIDSDVTGDNGPFTTSSLVVMGEDLENIDLGLIAATGGAINGVVWEDLDGDGIRETGEDLIGGLEVRLRTQSGTLVGITTTAGNGSYAFEDIPATQNGRLIISLHLSLYMAQSLKA